MMARIAIAVLAVAALVASVAAHGGSLHDWTFSDDAHKDLPRYTVATIDGKAFKRYDADRLGGATAPGPIPYFNTTKSYKVTGIVKIMNYLDDGCRETVALTSALYLTDAKSNKPVKNIKVYAYGMTGNCSQVGDLYRGNLTVGTTRLNLLWWRDGVTNNKGYIFGASPNIFTIRAPKNAEDTTGLRSVILVTQNYPIMCGDVKYVNAKPPGSWAKKVKTCSVDPMAAAHGK